MDSVTGFVVPTQQLPRFVVVDPIRLRTVSAYAQRTFDSKTSDSLSSKPYEPEALADTITILVQTHHRTLST